MNNHYHHASKDSDDSVSSSSSSSKSYLMPKHDSSTTLSSLNTSNSPSSSGNSASTPSSTNDATAIGPKTQAAFVNKLFSMVEDESIQDLISWSPAGDVFSVTNPTEFSKTVLPQYFKHNNWQSFVRQLNMYGFHKVNDMFHANPSGDNQAWEFKHPEFKRGAAELLQNIKRKSSKPITTQNGKIITSANSSMMDDERDDRTDSLARDLQDVTDRLKQMERAYERLYSDAMNVKGVQSRQQQVISNVVTVLESIVHDSDERDPQNSRRRYDVDILQQEIHSLNTDTSLSFNHPPPHGPAYSRSQRNTYPPGHQMTTPSSVSNNGNSNNINGNGNGSVNGHTNGSIQERSVVLPPLHIPNTYNPNEGSYVRRRASPDSIGYDSYRNSGMRTSLSNENMYRSSSPPPTQSSSMGKTSSVEQRSSQSYRSSTVSMSFGRESNLLNPITDQHGHGGSLHHRKTPSHDSQDTAKRRKL